MRNFFGIRRLFSLCLLLIGVLCFAFGDGMGAPSLIQSSSTYILLQDREPFYSPPVLTIRAGDMIEWLNRSSSEHTITHDGCGHNQRCAFHSGHLHPGERFSGPSLAPGRYPYHCEIHPFMRGVLVIEDVLPDFQSTEL